jgi:hypothetical protein
LVIFFTNETQAVQVSPFAPPQRAPTPAHAPGLSIGAAPIRTPGTRRLITRDRPHRNAQNVTLLKTQRLQQSKRQLG